MLLLLLLLLSSCWEGTCANITPVVLLHPLLGFLEQAGVDDLVAKLSDFIWADPEAKAVDEAAKAKFYEKHCNPATKSGRNGGAHLAYIESYLERNGGEKWVAGKDLTIADVAVFENFDKYLRVFPGLKEVYPKLSAHHAAFSQLDKVKEYIASEKRYASSLGHPNGLGN